MRALALPAALLLSFCLYLPLPRLSGMIDSGIARLYRRLLPLLDRRQIDQRHAPAVFLLLFCGAAALLQLLLTRIHPLLAALLFAPTITFPAALPACARMKDALDAGQYANDIPRYEANVRNCCLSLAPAAMHDCAAPLLLIAAGMPLHLSGALVFAYAALRALQVQSGRAARSLHLAGRISDWALCAMLFLCAGAVGRNPLHIAARGASDRLMRTLGVAGDDSDTHPPVSGDITQGIFLCCLCAALLCCACTLILLAIA